MVEVNENGVHTLNPPRFSDKSPFPFLFQLFLNVFLFIPTPI